MTEDAETDRARGGNAPSPVECPSERSREGTIREPQPLLDPPVAGVEAPLALVDGVRCGDWSRPPEMILRMSAPNSPEGFLREVASLGWRLGFSLGADSLVPSRTLWLVELTLLLRDRPPF